MKKLLQHELLQSYIPLAAAVSAFPPARWVCRWWPSQQLMHVKAASISPVFSALHVFVAGEAESCTLAWLHFS